MHGAATTTTTTFVSLLDHLLITGRILFHVIIFYVILLFLASLEVVVEVVVAFRNLLCANRLR